VTLAGKSGGNRTIRDQMSDHDIAGQWAWLAATVLLASM
jgi:hypothetical protein